MVATYMYTCILMYIYIYIYTYHMHVCICIYICIYRYAYIYIYVRKFICPGSDERGMPYTHAQIEQDAPRSDRQPPSRQYPGLLLWQFQRVLKGSFTGDNVDIDVDAEVDVDIDGSLGCLKRASKSV